MSFLSGIERAGTYRERVRVPKSNVVFSALLLAGLQVWGLWVPVFLLKLGSKVPIPGGFKKLSSSEFNIRSRMLA